MLDILLQELLPFAKIQFSRFFSPTFWDIDLVFGIWIYNDIIQINFEFRHAWRTFTRVIAFCLNLAFQTFLCSLLRYWLQIWYMKLSWLNTDQIRVSSLLTYFYRSYCPLLIFSFPDFFSAVIWGIDFKFGIWICHDIIQIKFEFRHAWPTFTRVIALC